ncbi:unnamed protein product [Caenorhabditis brenneri]
MIHLESLICYSCQTTQTRNLFDNTARRAIVGSCGHSICLECANPERNCPLCGRPEAFANGTVNYQALHLLEYYTINVFDVFRKWWETLGTPDIECRRCSTITNNSYLCSTCFHISTDHINVDTFSFCADCILDHHSGHETSKATENYSIRISTVTIVEKVLLGKLNNTEKEDEKKCKVRQLRMSITGKELIYRASTHYPLWTEEDCTDRKLLGRPKIPKDYVQNVLSSLEQQFDFLQKMTEPCPCVAVWEDVKRLNIFVVYGNPPHFWQW